MFRITNKHGFHITFENGYTVSVQFGPGNYCDNYNMRVGEDDELAGKQGSNTAECAMWQGEDELLPLPAFMGEDGDSVSNRSTPSEVLQLLNWAAES